MILDAAGLRLVGRATEVRITATSGRPLSPEDAERIACHPGTLWQRNPAPARIADKQSVVAAAEDGDSLILFTWPRGEAAAHALATCDPADIERLPATVAACLVAAQTQTSTASRNANLLPCYIARHLAAETNGSAHRLLPLAELERAAHNCLTALAAARPYSIPEGVLNRTRFWLAVGARLWQPKVAALTLPLTRAYPDLPALAFGHSQQLSEIEIAGLRFPFTPTNRPHAWMHFSLAARSRMPGDAARFLFAGGLPDDNLPAAFYADATLPKSATLALSNLSQALLRDAEAHAVFAPHGGFILRLPDGYPLAEFGVALCRVWVSAQAGLWLYTANEAQRPQVGIWWQPDRARERLNQPDDYTRATLLLELTAAALWRDLRVAGETVIRPAHGHARRNPPAPSTLTDPQPAASKVRILPAQRIILSGRREWGDDRERAQIERHAHGVRGHLRQLDQSAAASPEARALAEQFGLILPDGYTFVRPHVRGVAENDARAAEPETTVIHARGLATVMAFWR